MNDVISRSIKVIRLPLAALVVLKHYYTNEIVMSVEHTIKGIDIYSFMGRVSADYFPAFVVPLFFFISGVLFWIGFDKDLPANSFDFDLYLRKITKRLKSIFVPYILWNLIVLFSLLLCQYVSKDSINPLGFALNELRPMFFIKSLWAIGVNNYPIDGPLWFIRDLFIIAILSPFVYFFIKFFRFWGVLFLSLIYTFNYLPNITGLSSSCITFFTIGSFVSLSKVDLLDKLSKISVKYSFLAVVISFFTFLFSSNFSYEYYVLKHIYIFIVVLSIWSMVRFSLLKHDWSLCEKWEPASFIIYALHKPILYVVSIFVFKLFHPVCTTILCGLIIVIPFVVFVFCVCVYYLLKKYLPFFKCLNGYRL